MLVAALLIYSVAFGGGQMGILPGSLGGSVFGVLNAFAEKTRIIPARTRIGRIISKKKS